MAHSSYAVKREQTHHAFEAAAVRVLIIEDEELMASSLQRGLQRDGYAADVTLDSAILDQIDQIVPPGTTLNPPDRGYEPPSLTDASLRRR